MESDPEMKAKASSVDHFGFITGFPWMNWYVIRQGQDD